MSDIDIDTDTLGAGLAWGAVGFGVVGALAPRVFEAAYGLHDNPELRVMTRLWGTRTALLGVLFLSAEGEEERKRFAVLATGLNLADALITASAGPAVGKRSRILGSLSSAAFAAGYGSVISRS
ncbi:MAG: hypothetical protein JWR90_851 [Marmoricola sp.]|jgi:hypothetical protein|nr:hypothetical protein [Marmoricola sp.]